MNRTDFGRVTLKPFAPRNREEGVAVAHDDLIAGPGDNTAAGHTEGEEDIISADWRRMLGLYSLVQSTQGS
jgi:hypothetical protein